MKSPLNAKSFTGGLLVLSLAAIAYQPFVPRNIKFSWDYAADSFNPETNVNFNLYGSTNVSVPITNWTLLQCCIPGTNRTFVLSNVPPANWFFGMTVSNIWWRGESNFVTTNTPGSTNGSNINIEAL